MNKVKDWFVKNKKEVATVGSIAMIMVGMLVVSYGFGVQSERIRLQNVIMQALSDKIKEIGA